MHTRKLILLLLIFFKVSTSYAQNFSMNEHQINLLDRSQFEKKINGKVLTMFGFYLNNISRAIKRPDLIPVFISLFL